MKDGETVHNPFHLQENSSDAACTCIINQRICDNCFLSPFISAFRIFLMCIYENVDTDMMCTVNDKHSQKTTC
jgi:hypothetical protein